MDPASLLGAISASGAIVGAIAKTLHGLHEVREKFHGADVSVGLLMSELTAVKAAIIQIEDWVRFSSRNKPVPADLGPALEISLEGCKTAMDVLAAEVQNVLDDLSPEGPRFQFRARYVWNESTMKEHQLRLHTQVSALQLLLQAVQMRVNRSLYMEISKR